MGDVNNLFIVLTKGEYKHLKAKGAIDENDYCMGNVKVYVSKDMPKAGGEK